MPFLINPFIFGAGEPPAPNIFPLSLSMTNPDAETGDTTGWTQDFGANFGVGTSSPYAGTYKFIMSTDDAYAEVHHDFIDIPAEAQTDVDSGIVSLNLDIWRTDFTDTDEMRVRMEFYDAVSGGGNCIGIRSTNQWSDANETWTNSPYTWEVPPGTRSFAAFMFGRRVTGTELSCYWDEISYELVDNTAVVSETVYTDRGGTDLTGWTVDLGAGQPPSLNTWSEWGWTGIYGGSQVEYAIHKDIAVSSLSAAAQSAIAGGTATIHLHRYAWNENADDESRTFIECLASSTPVTTIQDAAVPTNWLILPDVLQDASATMDSSTDTIRINHDFDRVDGTVLDAQVAFIHVWIEY